MKLGLTPLPIDVGFFEMWGHRFSDTNPELFPDPDSWREGGTRDKMQQSFVRFEMIDEEPRTS